LGELGARAAVETGDEIGELAESFNTMVGRLQNTMSGLEEQVAERTRAIAISASVSRQLSTILDPAYLVEEVVKQLQEYFGYSHVHIYFFDDAGKNLVIVGGTGEAGKAMLLRGDSIARGNGLIGRACDSRRAVLVPDTSQEPAWMPNPLLPDTRSEAVVPIMSGEDILGALDVQQNVVNGLNEQDLDILELISNQVAIALRNSRQYSETRDRAEKQALINSIVQQIQSAQTTEKALQVVVRELGRALKTPCSHVWAWILGDNRISSD
jgi:GAF domain-containing protein